MVPYLITRDGLRLFHDSKLEDVLGKDCAHPIFAVYWSAREYGRPLLVVGRFPTHEDLREKTRWSMPAPSLPPHFERFDGVWKLTHDGTWEWTAGVLRVMPEEMEKALQLNR